MSEADTNFFGKRLEQLRQARGWSQKVLADKLETNESTVGRWERGLASPQSYYRQKLMDVFGKTLYELGLLEEQREQHEPKMVLEKITDILQQTSDASLPHKLQQIIDYVAAIASRSHSIPAPAASKQVEYMTSHGGRTPHSATEQQAVLARTEEQEHPFAWVGTKPVHLEKVISIETGTNIASWRYFQRGKEQRDPDNFDMHVHICPGQIVHYDPPILLTRLHILPAWTNARCVRMQMEQQDE